VNNNDILFTDIVTLLVTFFVVITVKIPEESKVISRHNLAPNNIKIICDKNGTSSALDPLNMKDVKKLTQIYRWESANLTYGMLQTKLDEVANIAGEVECNGYIAALIITSFHLNKELTNLIRERVTETTNSSNKIWSVIKSSSTEEASEISNSRLIIEVEQYGI